MLYKPSIPSYDADLTNQTIIKAAKEVRLKMMGKLRLKALAPLFPLVVEDWLEELGEVEVEAEAWEEATCSVEVMTAVVEKIDVLAVPSSTWK